MVIKTLWLKSLQIFKKFHEGLDKKFNYKSSKNFEKKLIQLKFNYQNLIKKKVQVLIKFW